jgi:hypothetical protein
MLFTAYKKLSDWLIFAGNATTDKITECLNDLGRKRILAQK